MSRFTGEYVADRKALHNAVRAEAGNRCIRCGHPEGDKLGKKLGAEYESREGKVQHYAMAPVPCDDRCTHPDNGKLRILTVHHLTGQKDDNRWWNLLALCQVCHLQIQGKVIPEVPYLWEHTDWFRPYACGFYAAYYGRLEITREQADAEPDRYLAMGQPWLFPENA
mgnify:CR=1 FL=1